MLGPTERHVSNDQHLKTRHDDHDRRALFRSQTAGASRVRARTLPSAGGEEEEAAGCSGLPPRERREGRRRPPEEPKTAPEGPRREPKTAPRGPPEAPGAILLPRGALRVSQGRM